MPESNPVSEHAREMVRLRWAKQRAGETRTSNLDDNDRALASLRRSIKKAAASSRLFTDDQRALYARLLRDGYKEALRSAEEAARP